MFQSLNKEAIAALVDGDDGLREYLDLLPNSERAFIDHLLESPEIFKSLLSLLPPDQQCATRSILNNMSDVPERALKLYGQCRFLEARKLLLKSIDLYELPPGLPMNGVVKAALFAAVRVKALCYELLGDVERTLGNFDKSAEYHNLALKLAQECGDKDTEAKALHGLACFYWELSDYEQALDLSQRALEVLDGRPDRWSTAVKVLSALSLIHAELSQIDEALEYGRLALTEAEESSDVRLLPTTLSNRSVQLTNLGMFDEAKLLLDRALTLSIDNGMIRPQALILHNLGMHHLNTAAGADDIESAQRYFQESLAISRRIMSVSLEAMACNGMARALVVKEDFPEAEKEYHKAIELQLSAGAIADAADSFVDLGNLIRFYRGAHEEALEFYCEAIKLVEQIRSKLKRETHRIGLAEIRTEPYHQAITTLLALGRDDEAFHYLERARSKALLELLAGQFDVADDGGVYNKAVEVARRIQPTSILYWA